MLLKTQEWKHVSSYMHADSPTTIRTPYDKLRVKTIFHISFLLGLKENYGKSDHYDDDDCIDEDIWYSNVYSFVNERNIIKQMSDQSSPYYALCDYMISFFDASFDIQEVKKQERRYKILPSILFYYFTHTTGKDEWKGLVDQIVHQNATKYKARSVSIQKRINEEIVDEKDRKSRLLSIGVVHSLIMENLL